ncbi:transcriptional regulator EutR [Methyloligella halotolerans]|uniref:Transcriptional regulator EutR n=1 Tax=Methyloligella halotolerans TaxID=1177755 RepID=A0A1E2RUX4_9HYPH|nr:helix-turn-helix domain-containing protein [Methyloligella halotolerans]ODA66056.1 transcriptional regulator EutR [Methyloligella halotolerans]
MASVAPPFGRTTEDRSSAAAPAQVDPLNGEGWTCTRITRIEELSDAVLGAGLDAVQISRPPLSAKLASAQHQGILLSSGYIDGRISLRGPLSESMITFGLGVWLAPGTRHWLNEVSTGDIGVFMPGDEHDALYTPGTIYAAVTLSSEAIETMAEARGLILDVRSIGGSGVHARPCDQRLLIQLQRLYRRLHEGPLPSVAQVAETMLDAIAGHFSRLPKAPLGQTNPQGYARIVSRSREYILAHLDRPLNIDDIANAASVSRRTLHRAFARVLDESPQTYVRKLRLHRIRRDLTSEVERACTIATIANQWGISELGRFSGWYRELFGELPSKTRAQNRQS